MTTHIAGVRHLTSGWKRWYGRCTCGWASAPTDQDEANSSVAAHLASVGATAGETQR